MGNSFVADIRAALVLTETPIVRLNVFAAVRTNSTVVTSIFDVQSLLPQGSVVADDVGGSLNTGESMFKLDAGINLLARVALQSINLTKGALFVDSTGVTGTFTAVTDVSVASTIVTSIADSSGLARFNFTVGPTLFVGQVVTLAGFTDPLNVLFNLQHTITVVGVGFFEVAIAFGADETGTFTSDVVEITETATAASDDLGITLTTTDGAEYDRNARVFNKTTNAFYINLPFGGTRAGTWTTKTLDQTNRHVSVKDSPLFSESNTFVDVRVKANTTVTSVSDGVYAAVDFTSQPMALELGELFKVTDADAGIVTYTGLDDINVRINWHFWSTKSGSEQDYQGTISTNSAIPTFATAPSSPLQVKSSKAISSVTQIIPMVTDDTFQLMVAGVGTGDDLTVTDVSATVGILQ